MKCKKRWMQLYAVTDRAWTGRQTLYEQVESALRGGATCVQLREKHLSEEEFLAEAIEMHTLCARYGVPLIINDRADIAVQSGAEGVHVGQKDRPARDVRRLIGEDRILGVSARTVEQALAAQEAGADYLGVGAVYGTSTKEDAVAVSHETVRRIREAVSIPIVAIGGITRDNLPGLSGCGVDGVALVSAIFGAGDIEAECRELLALSRQMTGNI